MISIEVIYYALGICTGLIGVLISLLTYSLDFFNSVNSFYQYMLDSKFIDARRFIYNLDDNTVIDMSSPVEDQNCVAIVANAYNHWGLLISHHQLPKWLFYDRKNGITAAGIAVIRLYNKLKPTIDYRRNHGNVKYAEYFQNLYNLLIKKFPNYAGFTG